MKRRVKKKVHPKKKRKTGLPPGSLVFTGKRKLEAVSMAALHYDTEQLRDIKFSPGKFTIPEKGVTWIDIRGLHEVEIIDAIGKTLNIHSLVLEDVVDINQRPKFDEYGDAFFIVINDPTYNPEHKAFEMEQVGIYVTDRVVVSFQEHERDIFNTVKERIRVSRGRIRGAGTVYLAYALVDRIVDNFFEALDSFQLELDELEERISFDDVGNIKSELLNLKKELLHMRRVGYPMREALSRFTRDEHPLIRDETRIYIRDVYDHIIQVLEILESHRDVLSGLQDLMLSELSFSMNKVMQVLTLIATIFIPLTFVAGIYGMNFEYMPELQWRYGYFIILGVMLIIAVGLLIYFKRKDWLN
jgi:magnesium transporter